jgi:transcriptional regulator with XRE-family HTH domain
MHPIAAALRERGWTQQQLVDRVNKLRPRHLNGELIKLSQGQLSELISEKSKRRRGLSVQLAKAIASTLEIDPAELLLYERPAPSRRSRAA